MLQIFITLYDEIFAVKDHSNRTVIRYSERVPFLISAVEISLWSGESIEW